MKGFHDMVNNEKLSKENLTKTGNELKKQVKSFDGKYYEYNIERNGIYYCPNNLIIDLKQKKMINLPAHQILADYFIIDTKENKVSVYDKEFRDGFLATVKDIERIDVNNGIVTMIKKDDKIQEPEKKCVKMKLDAGKIIEFEDNNLTSCGLQYLAWCNSIKKLSMANLKEEREGLFLGYNKTLENLYLPKLETCSIRFLHKNQCLKELSLPKLRQCSFEFMFFNNSLLRLHAPELENVGPYFMGSNTCLQELNANKLSNIDYDFMDSYRGPIKDDIAKRFNLTTYWEKYKQKHLNQTQERWWDK